MLRRNPRKKNENIKETDDALTIAKTDLERINNLFKITHQITLSSTASPRVKANAKKAVITIKDSANTISKEIKELQSEKEKAILSDTFKEAMGDGLIMLNPKEKLIDE